MDAKIFKLSPRLRRNMITTRSIARRYAAALLLIAAVLILSHTLLLRQISRNERDGYIINISGMQRMLSQRIGLMAMELSRSDDSETASLMASKLEKAFLKMKSNLSELNQENEQAMTPEIESICYGDAGLNQRVTDYLSLAERLLNQYRQQPDQKQQQTETAEQIVKIARNGLLEELDSVVFQYQKEYEQRIEHFRNANLAFMLVGLCVLLLEAVFIFRPMSQQISSTMSKLENSNSELRHFAYRISHDLRAPVASSMGLAEMVGDSLQEGDTDFAIEGTGRIKNAMKKLDGLIADIITVTKNKQLTIEPELVEVESMIDEILESHKSFPGFERINVDKKIEGSSSVSTMRSLLNQTLENLISNAIKYSDPTETSPKLVIKVVEGDKTLEIEVSDNGIGFPSESKDQIFGMFKRFHPRQSFGSGLGLYLVKQNVRAMKGTIHYHPLPKGSAFVIKIPHLPTGISS